MSTRIVKNRKTRRMRLQLRCELLEARQLLAVFQVVNTNDDGTGSLREALFQTQASPGIDQIVFALDVADPNFDPVTTTWTIPIVRSLTIESGSLVDNVVNLDATTQPQYAALQRPVVRLRPSANGFTGDAALIVNASDSLVRGLAIGGFPAAGIQVFGTRNTLEGNHVGVSTTGDTAEPNAGNGVEVSSPNNAIGRAVNAPRNVISGNQGSGIVFGTDATANLVVGNLIGTNAAGDAAIGNGVDGIEMQSRSNTIEGGNVVSGNLRNGIAVNGGVNQIRSNIIGTALSGALALPNGANGLAISSEGNEVTQNLVSGNQEHGIVMSGARNLVLLNRIGTNAAGTGGVPNAGAGVRIIASNQSGGNSIGGPVAGQENTIAFNGNGGISIDQSIGNFIGVNAIFDNSGLGIALLNGGNENQSTPVLGDATADGIAGLTRVAFSLTSLPNTSFTLFFFSNPAGSANPQGRTFLGLTTVTTDAPAGFVSGTFETPTVLADGTLVTAIATRDIAPRNSSQFSPATRVGVTDPFVVINTNDAGPGSLRQVITNANNAPGFNVVRFAIPGAGVHTIVPLSTLPSLDETVSVDATTQPGYAGTPLVVVDGINAPGDGFLVVAANTTIKGLVIQRFVEAGIHVRGADFGTFENLYIGTDATGTQPRANGIGILIDDSANALVQGNVISGNLTAGLYINGGKSTGAVIQDNRIGTDATGTQAVARDSGSLLENLQNTGVVIVGASSNTIGGSVASARNIISGNYVGVMIAGAGGNTVWGNLIGTNATGLAPLPNIVGVYLNAASNNAIGGTDVGAGNTISANRETGVVIFGASSGNVLAGNVIGLGVDGRTELRATNGTFVQTTGVYLLNASNNQIGGSGVGARNIISGNRENGVFIQARGGRASGNVVQGNFVGLNIDGINGPGNGGFGVVLFNAPGNTVTQTGPSANQFFGNRSGNVRDFRGPGGAAALRAARRRLRAKLAQGRH